MTVYEAAAWCLSLVCGIVLFVVRIEADATQKKAANLQVATAPVMHPLASLVDASSTATKGKTYDANDLMGRLEIHGIGLTVPIMIGFDAADLRKGVGHIRGTALPGGLGNMVLAGHRDTFFRPLRNVRRGMVVSVVTSSGRFEYVVDSTTVVDPDQVSVLQIHDVPEMTLITCYRLIMWAQHRGASSRVHI